MAKCPYCEAEVHLEDFFEQKIKYDKQGNIKRKKITKFKGENYRIGIIVQVKMWICPYCDKILNFSESGDI